MASIDQIAEAITGAHKTLANLPDGETIRLGFDEDVAWCKVYSATLSEVIADVVTVALKALDLAKYCGQWQHGNVLESCARSVPDWSPFRAQKIVELFSMYIDAFQARSLKEVPF